MCSSLGAKIFFTDVTLKQSNDTSKFNRLHQKNNIKKIKAVVTMYMGGYPENIIDFYKLKKIQF